MLASLIRWLPLIFPLYVIRFRLGPFPTSLLELAFLGIGAAAILPSNRHIWKQGWKTVSAWRIAGIAWLGATLIATIVAPNHLAALGLWRAFVLEPLAYAVLLAGSIQEKKQAQETINAFVLGGIWIALFCVVQFSFNLGIPHPWNTDILHRRATGPFPFPNAVALYCAPLAALCIGLMGKQETRKQHFFLALGYAAALSATLLAKSVGGLIAIGAATWVALFFHPRIRPWLLATSLLLGLVVGLTPNLRTPLIRNLSFGDWSGKVRLVIWKETRSMLADRPIQGAGFGAYPTVIKPYHTATWMEIFQYPHNILLNLWSETGLAGVAAFAVVCFTWICLTWQKKQCHLLLPLLAILVHGLVDVPYFKNDLAFAFWTYAILGTVAVTQKPHNL